MNPSLKQQRTGGVSTLLFALKTTVGCYYIAVKTAMQNLVLGASNVKRYCECQHSPVFLGKVGCMEKSVWTQTSTCITGQQSKRTDCSSPWHLKKKKQKKTWSLKICSQIRHHSMGRLHKFRLKATLHYLCWNARDTTIGWNSFQS